MRRNNYLREKIYIFILLTAYAFAAGEPKKVNIRIEGAKTQFDTVYNYGIFWAICCIGLGLIFIRDIIRKGESISMFNKEIPYYQFMRGQLYVLTVLVGFVAGCPTRSEGFDLTGAVFIIALLLGIIILRDYIVSRRQNRNPQS